MIIIYKRNVLFMARCKWCNETFIKKHNREEYCCDEHRKYARQEQNRKHRIKHYYRYSRLNIQTYSQYKKELGTGSLSNHKNNDISVELKLIKKEKTRIGI